MITATIATLRHMTVTKGVSRKIVRNATVRVTAKSATVSLSKVAVMANATTREVKVAVMGKYISS